jgi:uncharacterized caspase-like protein
MPGRQIALLIGNGRFNPESGFASLRCPSRDVEGFGSLLTNETHGSFEVTSLVDATQREVQMAVWETLNQKAGTDDLVLLYYSGHGCPDVDGSLFLASSDSAKSNLPVTAVQLEFIVARMRASRSQKIVLILDCCFSGAVERLFTKGEVADQVRTVLPKELSGSGTYVLTASTDTQLAEEKEADDYSLLTKHIIGGIANGQADRDDDGIVTMHDLLLHVQSAVKTEGKQEPLGFALRMGGGDLAIARTGKPAQSTKRRAVEAAVWNARENYHLPMKTAQCIWTMISEKALMEGGEAARRHLDRLHGLLNDPPNFVQELHDLYEASERHTSPMATTSPVRTEPSFSESLSKPDIPQPPRTERYPWNTRTFRLMSLGVAILGVFSSIYGVVVRTLGKKDQMDQQQSVLRQADEPAKTKNSVDKRAASVIVPLPAANNAQNPPPLVSTENQTSSTGNQTSETPKARDIALPSGCSFDVGQELCTISFERDRLRPARIDGEAKACLDEVALRLQRSPEAVLLIVGQAVPGEKLPVGNLSAMRAYNAANYLEIENGIDSARLLLRVGPPEGKMVRMGIPPSPVVPTQCMKPFDPKSVPGYYPLHRPTTALKNSKK